MNISAVGDLSSYIPREATAAKAGQVQQQIAVAVLKEVIDQQKTAGESILKLIQSSTPGRVDIRV